MTTDVGCLMCRGKTPPRGARCKTCGRKGEPIEHTCHADGCDVEVPPRMLMCLRHWRMVPRTIQRQIWNEYVPGQEITKTPTAQYVYVMKEAIDAVARKEKRR